MINKNAIFFPLSWSKWMDRFFLLVLLLNVARAVRENATPTNDFKKICDTKVFIADDIIIPFTCDGAVKERYLQNRESYQRDIMQFKEDLLILAKTPEMHCQLAEVVKENAFKVKLVDYVPIDNQLTEDTVANVGGMYQPYEQTLMFSNVVTHENSSLLRTQGIKHEFHHAYMGARNNKLGVNGLLQKENGEIHEVTSRSFAELSISAINERVLPHYGKKAAFFWSTYPGKKWGEFIEMQNIFSTVKRRFEHYIQLLRMSESGAELDVETKKILNDLSAVTKNYVPKAGRFPMDPQYTKTLMQEGILDQQCNLVRQFMAPRLGINIYFARAKINPSNLRGTIYGYTVMPDGSPENCRKAALLDGYFSIKAQEEAYLGKGPINLLIEMDAHLQERYGLYPELFEYLLPELVDYHKEINAPVLEKCLTKLVQSNIDGIDRETKKVLSTNSKKLENNPSDPWALYYVVDTYIKLARSHYQSKNMKLAILSMSIAFQHCLDYLKVANVAPVEKLYFQVIENYMIYLMEDKQYFKAITIGNQAWLNLPKSYQPSYASTWAVHCEEGVAYLGIENYVEAEKFLKKSRNELHDIFDQKSSQYNPNESNIIKEYATTRIQELYQYLEQVQRKLEKYRSADNTLSEGKKFLRDLKKLANDDVLFSEEENTARFEL